MLDPETTLSSGGADGKSRVVATRQDPFVLAPDRIAEEDLRPASSCCDALGACSRDGDRKKGVYTTYQSLHLIRTRKECRRGIAQIQTSSTASPRYPGSLASVAASSY